MYFSRLTFNFKENRNYIKNLMVNNYREHQILWNLFDKDPTAKRDFLYRKLNEKGNIKYYLLSHRKPFDRKSIWNIDGPKIYKPNLKKDQKLFFMLRANPTVHSSNHGGKRHDVVMNKKTQMGFKNLPLSKKPPLHKLISDSCIKWLNKKSNSNGFSFNEKEIMVDGYQKIRIYKVNKPNIFYSAVDFKGFLTVLEPEIFKSVLEKGIGKSKAFGCGLMLVKRA